MARRAVILRDGPYQPNRDGPRTAIFPSACATSNARPPSTTRPSRRSAMSASGRTSGPANQTRPSATARPAATTSSPSSSRTTLPRRAPVFTSPRRAGPAGRQGLPQGRARGRRNPQRPAGTVPPLWRDLLYRLRHRPRRAPSRGRLQGAGLRQNRHRYNNRFRTVPADIGSVPATPPHGAGAYKSAARRRSALKPAPPTVRRPCDRKSPPPDGYGQQ